MCRLLDYIHYTYDILHGQVEFQLFLLPKKMISKLLIYPMHILIYRLREKLMDFIVFLSVYIFC